ncbi:hypothetical protein TNCV_319451 [Trichonephila clavipes]|nr:hypothetical protein TNCV_319451 [Trichonephila clavipes]
MKTVIIDYPSTEHSNHDSNQRAVFVLIEQCLFEHFAVPLPAIQFPEERDLQVQYRRHSIKPNLTSRWIWNRFWRLEVQAEDQDKVRRSHPPMKIVICLSHPPETPKYERYCSPRIPSLGYWHHGFNSRLSKPAPWCRSVCSPIDAVCVRLASRHRRDRRVGNRAWKLEEK